MPEKKTVQRAKKAKREGKAPSTQAGEFIREEIHHIREGKHGAKNAKQAIAIGLSKARRSGVALDAPKKGTAKNGNAKKGIRQRAKRDLSKGKKSASRSAARPSAKRSAAAKRALKRQPRAAVSHRALSRHARQTPRRNRTKRAASSGRSRAGANKRVSR